MTAPRPLRDLIADLVGADLPRADAAALLRAAGHVDLPADLVADAIASYADTAPLEVAEHLAPFVTDHTASRWAGADAVPVDLADGLELLATASRPGFDTETAGVEPPDFDFGAGAPRPQDAVPDVTTPPPTTDGWWTEVGHGTDLPEPAPAGDDDTVGPLVAPTVDDLDGDDDADDVLDA